MIINKALLLFLILIIDLKVCHSQIDYDSCNLKITKQQLINELASYSKYWVDDSLANNGFRRFFGREFFRCSGESLEGTNWNTIFIYLGKPHFTFKAIKDYKNFLYSKDEVLYRYVLYTYGDYRDFKEIGNLILDVIVIQGVIKSIGVYENDG